ncbi:putative quinol monooxygenase [Sandaracinobacteroides saxicola]|uniref:Antibiotic biosynthesis monooxygenase n=1 Tax=Sandaracinobacteroides saxicola TaxID=2759707 RepID=A0A7G5IGV3_9SPHN|nr:putative quinol monooxygenase [Sandaracinobacteroides saxicola]QMW22595.1 antibiotic biosynthesis monooxygenase [Sandaracinobacteroides saxicola]
MIIIMGRAEVKPQRLAALSGALNDMMRATWAESGCLSYSLAVESDGSDGHPAVLCIAERWADAEALKAHFKAPHMAAFNKAAEGAVLSLDVKMYDASNERPLAL